MTNIKQMRKELNLTQRQLAAELGLAKNGDVYIRKVENGRAQPSGLFLRAIEMLYELKNKPVPKHKRIYEKIYRNLATNRNCP